MIKIAVIGGGASGLVASIYAKNCNTVVDLYEKNDEIGKKIGAFRNNETDYDRVYKRVIKDLQDGYLGKVTFDNIN